MTTQLLTGPERPPSWRQRCHRWGSEGGRGGRTARAPDSALPSPTTAVPMMLPPPSEQALGQLLARKEEEWRALRAHRCQLQEAALQDAHSQLHEAQGALRRLREDFVYNLQVLDERDRELERYDTAFAQARPGRRRGRRR